MSNRELVGAHFVGVPPFQGTPELGLGCVPNPVRSRADIRFLLPAGTRVSVEIFDLSGRRMATLVHNAVMGAGPHQVELSAGALKTNVYYARLMAGSRTATRAFMVVH